MLMCLHGSQEVLIRSSRVGQCHSRHTNAEQTIISCLGAECALLLDPSDNACGPCYATMLEEPTYPGVKDRIANQDLSGFSSRGGVVSNGPRGD